MASLLDSIGGGLLDSDYMRVRSMISEIKDEVRNLKGENTLDRAPFDQSLYGKLVDPTLRKLPPSLRDEAKRAIDINGYLALKSLKSNLSTGLKKLLSINNDKLNSLTKPVQLDPSKESELVDPLTEDPGPDEHIGNRPKQEIFKKSTIRFTEDGTYQDEWSGSSGYKVTIVNGEDFDATRAGDSPINENKIVNNDRINALKFRPKDDSLWLVTLDKYTEGSYESALPDIPVFSNEFSEDTIDYLTWLPATEYSYSRRSTTTNQINYGNSSFSLVNSMSRGFNFTLSLEDDRDHSFSRYAKEVINRSVGMEDMSMTYWECLIHKINLFILDKQWRVTERFTLLGILTSDGFTEYSTSKESNLKLNFSIVGELTDTGSRYIEQL